MLLKGLCPSHSVALSALINKRCTLADVRAGRELSIYIQSIVTNAKDAKFDTAFQQLTWAWRNLDPVLKRDIKQPNEDTTLTAFLEEVESKKEVWQEVYQPRGQTFTRQDNYGQVDRRDTRQLSSSRPQGNYPYQMNPTTPYFPNQYQAIPATQYVPNQDRNWTPN